MLYSAAVYRAVVGTTTDKYYAILQLGSVIVRTWGKGDWRVGGVATALHSGRHTINRFNLQYEAHDAWQDACHDRDRRPGYQLDRWWSCTTQTPVRSMNDADVAVGMAFIYDELSKAVAQDVHRDPMLHPASNMDRRARGIDRISELVLPTGDDGFTDPTDISDFGADPKP